MSQEFNPASVPLDYYYKAACQRASLMAFMSALLEFEGEMDSQAIKSYAASWIVRAIDNGHMVRDEIDYDVCSKAASYLQQEMAVSSIKKFLNQQ